MLVAESIACILAPFSLATASTSDMSVLEQDVSGQVHDVPVVGHVGDVHLVLNFDYEVPSEPGSDGAGFDVDVDDWDDVNVDIVL